jgi:hypothetical protein
MAHIGNHRVTQPSEIKIRRTECIKAIKVFEESEKRIRMDPDISKLVKRTEKESKYVSIGLVSINNSASSRPIKYLKRKRRGSRSSMHLQPNHRLKRQIQSQQRHLILPSLLQKDPRIRNNLLLPLTTHQSRLFNSHLPLPRISNHLLKWITSLISLGPLSNLSRR